MRRPWLTISVSAERENFVFIFVLWTASNNVYSLKIQILQGLNVFSNLEESPGAYFEMNAQESIGM